eukprot:PhF_6_TR15077/c0_g1_i2/m.23710
MKTFFDRVFGFSESIGFDETREKLKSMQVIASHPVYGEIIHFRCLPEESAKRIQAGRFEVMSLGELRALVSSSSSAPPPTTSPTTPTVSIINIVGLAGKLHCDPANEGSVFQVASGLNCLEFANPYGRPEEGIGVYMFDQTQGPACAIACAGGSAVRNYCVGQTSTNQINMMSKCEELVNNKVEKYWAVVNGYIDACDNKSLDRFNAWLKEDTTRYDTVRDSICVGIQHQTQVTSADCTECIIVTQ